MSSPLAIGAVSAVLRNLLDNGMVDVGPAVGSVKVTAVAPDTIKLDDPDAGPSLNLFLYRVSPNPGLAQRATARLRHQRHPADEPAAGARPALPAHRVRRERLPRRDPARLRDVGPARAPGARPRRDPHARSTRARSARRSCRRRSRRWPPPTSPTRSSPSRSPSSRSTARRCRGCGPRSRRTTGRPRRTSCRSCSSRPPSRPRCRRCPSSMRSLSSCSRTSARRCRPCCASSPPDQQPAARLGETVTLEGAHLDGTSVEVHFAHPLLDDPHTVTIGANDDPLAIDVTLPTGATAFQQWPAGVWTVSVDLVRAGETVTRTTNVAAMVLAPTPVLAPAPTITAGRHDRQRHRHPQRPAAGAAQPARDPRARLRRRARGPAPHRDRQPHLPLRRGPRRRPVGAAHRRRRREPAPRPVDGPPVVRPLADGDGAGMSTTSLPMTPAERARPPLLAGVDRIRSLLEHDGEGTERAAPAPGRTPDPSTSSPSGSVSRPSSATWCCCSRPSSSTARWRRLVAGAQQGDERPTFALAMGAAARPALGRAVAGAAPAPVGSRRARRPARRSRRGRWSSTSICSTP